MTIWNLQTGRYAYMTTTTWRDVRVGQRVIYDGEEWLVVRVRPPR